MDIFSKMQDENIFRQAFEQALRDSQGRIIDSDSLVVKESNPFEMYHVKSVTEDGWAVVYRVYDDDTFGPDEGCHISELADVGNIIGNYVTLYKVINKKHPFNL